jgi:polar amino acid transport system permease protein
LGYQWTFGPIFSHFDVLLKGALGTAELVFWSLLLALPLGLVLALIRLAKVPVLSTIAGIYVEIFRSAPSIVLIYWFFFAFPVLIGLQFTPTVASVLAVGLQASAFMCEVFRGGIAAIPKGQWESSRALGMSTRVTFTTIVMPQVVRNILPVALNRLIDLIKTTALAASIAYSEVVYSAMRVSSVTYRPLEAFTILGLMFFVVIFILSQISRLIERRLRQADA